MTTVTFDYDDMAYEIFAKKAGKDNVVQVIKKLMSEYSAYSALNNELAKPTTNQPTLQPNFQANFTAKKSKIGALPDIKMPDNFDDIEVTDFDKNTYKFTDKSDNKENSYSIEMQIMPKENRPYRLGALPNIKVPDNFDKIEVTDFDV